MMEFSTQFCPVPLEQQPVNEYENLKISGFFRWSTLETATYRRKLAWIAFWSALLISPIAAASFPLKKYPLLFGLSCGIGAILAILLLLTRMLLGWYYIQERLNAETIFYEESGWYDGQTWQKPLEVLTRDRLIVSYQIAPVLRRLHHTVLIMVILLLVGASLWFILWDS